MKQFYVFFVLAAAASATSDSDGLITTALKFVKDCNEKSLTLCIKVRDSEVMDQTMSLSVSEMESLKTSFSFGRSELFSLSRKRKETLRLPRASA